MWARVTKAATIAGLLLSNGPSLANWAESNGTCSNRKVFCSNQPLEDWNLWVSHREDFCCVKDLIIVKPHVGNNNANTELVGLPVRLSVWGRSSEWAPLPTFVSLRGGERIAVTAEVNLRMGTGRKAGFRVFKSTADSGLEPTTFVFDFAEVCRAQLVDNVPGGKPSYILRAQSCKKGKPIFGCGKSQTIDANWTVKGCFDRNPRSEVALGDLACVSERFSAFLNGLLSGLGADLRRFSGYSRIMKRADDEDYTENADQKGEFSPKGLILSCLRGAPLYAKALLMGILGWLASSLINESGIRRYYNRWQGALLFALGMVCMGLGLLAACLFA